MTLLLMLTKLFDKSSSLRFLNFENISKSNIILKLFDERDREVRFTSLDINLGIEPYNLL